MPFKPGGYPSLSPYLTVNGAQATVDFLMEVFAAKVRRLIPGEGGLIAHVELQIDDSVVMITDAVEGWPAVPSHVHLYVEDVDAVYARAISAGGEAVQEPAQKDDGDKRGGFMDPGGTTWWVSTQMV